MVTKIMKYRSKDKNINALYAAALTIQDALKALDAEFPNCILGLDMRNFLDNTALDMIAATDIRLKQYRFRKSILDRLTSREKKALGFE